MANQLGFHHPFLTAALPKITLATASVLAEDGTAGLTGVYYHASPVISGPRYQSGVLEDYAGQS